MNWAFYILAGLVVILTIVEKWWDYLLKHVFSDGRTNNHKSLRTWLFWLTLTLFVANQVVGVLDNHQKGKRAKRLEGNVDALTNQLAGISSENLKLRDTINQGFRDISHQFSTNTAISPAIRLAILGDALDKVHEEGNQFQKAHELFTAGATDIQTLRAERANELDLQENQKRQAWIQQNIDEIKSEKRTEERDHYQQLKDQGLLKSKKILTDQILPIFDRVIERLAKMLDDFSNATGEKRFSDFPGTTPNVYASDLVKDGTIINGTNFICIGTNSAWNFKISTTVAPLLASPIIFWPPPPPFGFDGSLVFHEPYVSINVVSRTTNGDSVLTITPYRVWQPDIIYPSPPPEPPPMADRLFYPQISIKLRVPNGLNLDEMQPSTNYASAIDKAIRRLIEAQDQQYPLSTTRQP